MKNKILTTIAVAVCLAAGVAQPLRAQDPSRIERSERRRAAMLGLAPSPAETPVGGQYSPRSEEHTSELQSRENLVCRLLLEKKKSSGRRRRAAQTKASLTRSTPRRGPPGQRA